MPTRNSLNEALPGRYIWRVRYDTRFESSSGMERYHKDYKDNIGLVATTADTIAEVENVLMCSMDKQTKLLRLHEAHFIGKAIGF